MLEFSLDPGVALLLLAGLGVAAWGWAYRLQQGVAFHPVTNLLFLSVSVIFFLLVEGGSWSQSSGVPPFDLALLGASALLAASYSYRVTRLLRFGDGGAGYRAGVGVPMLWLFLLLVAVYVQVVVLGQVTVLRWAVFRGFPSPVAPLAPQSAGAGALVLALVGGLFAISTGIVLGQEVGVYARFARGLRRRRPISRRVDG